MRRWSRRRPQVPLELTQLPAADAADAVRDRTAHAALLRLPIDRTGLHAIPLYTETTVVVAPKEHVVTAAEELTAADLADEIVLHPLDDALDWTGPPGLPAIERPATTGDAIQLVAAGVGLLVVPLSLARLHHRKDLTYRPLTDAPQSQVALSWIEGETTELVEEFIGIVRGRTENSTRGRQEQGASAQPPAEGTKKRTGGKSATGGGKKQPPAGKRRGGPARGGKRARRRS
nr:LysR family substrate-binding domain-containing protein [Saccharopolyspora sp. HNM0983]